jgi:MSHA biogenesis protein MshL
MSAPNEQDAQTQCQVPHSLMHMLQAFARTLAPVFLLAGCGPMPVEKTDGHIKSEPARAAASIPQPVKQVALPPPPQSKAAEVKYSIVVNDVPVRDVLFAIAKGTNVNIDIHPGIEGRATLNAIDQSLKQILTRISKQVDMRFETDGPNIVVMPDSPFLRVYKVDYVNMSRDTTGSVGVQSQVAGPGLGGSAGSAAGGSQNSSMLKIDNTAKNRFWETLERNVKDLLRETDKELPEGSTETFVQARGAQQAATTQTQRTAQTRPSTSGTTTQSITPGTTDILQAGERIESRLTFREKASVIVNSESGTIAVRATSRQHEKISEFLEQVLGSAKRQVLIEATVVEVLLNDNYQAGVDWSALGLEGLGYSFRQNFIGTNLPQPPFFSVQYANPNATSGGSIAGTVKLLSSFGTARVLSTPRIMTLNNQTAVLKVVENSVYFTVQSQITAGQQGQASIVTYTSTPIVVPVGFVMSVTPQISDGDVVVLSVRPNVSSIIGSVKDPNPDLAKANVESLIPVIQTREFESMMRISSGQTAILGGLMKDSFATSRDGLPMLSRIPIWGDAVSFRNDTGRKSELVIFLRPIVIKEASLESDLAAYRRFLPDGDFFKDAELPRLNPLPKSNPDVPEASPGKAP